MRIKKRLIQRQKLKFSEGEFLYELDHSYKLSPKFIKFEKTIRNIQNDNCHNIKLFNCCFMCNADKIII